MLCSSKSCREYSRMEFYKLGTPVQRQTFNRVLGIVVVVLLCFPLASRLASITSIAAKSFPTFRVPNPEAASHPGTAGNPDLHMQPLTTSPLSTCQHETSTASSPREDR